MKYANLKKPSRNFFFAMVLAAGMTSFPLPTMATPAVQDVQQSGIVKGHVVDKNGEPIIGATVKVNGSQLGAVTDFDGNFELKNAPARCTDHFLHWIQDSGSGLQSGAERKCNYR